MAERMFGDSLSEEELGPRMAVVDDLLELIRSGKARIVEKSEWTPINGRPMVKFTIELLD